VALVAGHDQYSELAEREDSTDFKTYEFLTEGFDELLAAADVVISRAGATTIVELAALAKAVILVPNAMLPSSHQVKNADMLAKAGAAMVLNDEELSGHPRLLVDVVKELLENDVKRAELADNLHKFAKPHAAHDLAEIIVKTAK
jgi:UDP-N-acetylglucosamine--N-acetylmuramyl-(pentapeptide) pyrophosphoryl-undecaprenol N-acetylglucosamine transferase